MEAEMPNFLPVFSYLVGPSKVSVLFSKVVSKYLS
jgi:hypothetical protein